MTTEEINKLQQLDKKIKNYERYIDRFNHYRVRIAFYGCSDDLYFNDDPDFVRKSDLNDTIYSCLRDTYDDLVKRKEDLILCIKDEVYKPYKL